MSDERCEGCFIECKPYEMVSPKFSRPFPCLVELRMWAEAHRNDKGDEQGYVWEVENDRYQA